MTYTLKIKTAAVLTALVAALGVTTAAAIDTGIADARDRSGCC